jgi:hypothetical protein
MKRSPSAGFGRIQKTHPGFSRNYPEGATKASQLAMPWTCLTFDCLVVIEQPKKSI